MPSIPPDQRAALVKPLGVLCDTCRQDIIQNYCRQCDEFFRVCWCLHEGQTHADHRVYVWTAAGVMAIPDFDNFPYD